jgi:putative ABC transport system substrate-binding protein
MKKRIVVSFVATLLLVSVHCVDAQQLKKVPRVGFLSTGVVSSNIAAFQQGLRELGYVEGQNIILEYRYGDGQPEQLSPLAADLVRLKVDVIVATATLPALAAQQATKTIPIVMANADDPVRNGLVGSLPRPGGNITGLALIASELGAKRIAVLKEVVPKASRMVVLYQGKNPVMPTWFEELRYEARRLGGGASAARGRACRRFRDSFRISI